MNKNYLIPLFLLFTIILKGQVGIGTTSPAASAVLDIQSSSNDKGILIPRMTQAQRNAISSPATGLMIFQTDGNSGFYFYDGSSWDGFGEVKSVNGNTAAANGDVTLTFLATQTGTQAQRSVTSSPTDGLVHIVTGDTAAENGKVYIYSTGLSTWTLSSGFTDTDEQDISGSSFTDATSALVIDIEDGSGQTLSLSALEELVTDTDPSTNLTSASEGDLAYDTTDDELQAYDGTNWLSVNTSAVTPTLDQVTDVGSTTTNSIEVGGATVTGDLTVNTNTTLEGNTTIGDATSYDITVTARLDSNLIPKTDNARNLGDSALNFGEVNTRNLLSNAAMTVSATGILTLNSSATGTPTISFQQGGTEMAGIGSSTFFVGDSAAGTHYFLPPQYNVSRVSGYDPNETSVLGTNSALFPNEMVFFNVNDVVTKTISDVTQIDNATPYGILITGGAFTVSGTSSGFNDDVSIQGSLTDSLTISLGLINGTDVLNIDALLNSSIALKRGTLNIGTPSVTLQTLYTQFIDSGTNSELNLNSGDENGVVNFTVDGSTIAGVNSSTLMVTNGSSFYSFPEISTLPATPENQVLAYTATNTLNFYTLPFPITGTVTGSTLRYNPTSSAWEETELIRYDPTNGGSTTVTISGTLTPGVDNTFSLGTSSNEFSKLFTQKIETTESDIEFSTNNQSINLKLDASRNLTFSTSTTTFSGSSNLAFGDATLRSSNSTLNTALGNNALTDLSLSGEKNTAVGYNSMGDTQDGNENTAIGHNSLSRNISGNNNLAIGTNAGLNIRESQNIVIGSGANVGSTSVENAIVIGYNATAPQSNYIQLGTISSTLLNTSAVVSATGFNTTGTATITTLTVGDTSKYTLPTTRGTAGQVLTVSTTTSQLVFASNNPYYILAEANDGQGIVSDDTKIEFPGAYLDSNNGITIGSDGESFDLPAGKIYKCVGYVDIDLAVAKNTSVTTQFYDGSTAIGVQGVYNLLEDVDGDGTAKYYTAGAGPATAVIDATSSSKNITFRVVTRTQNFDIEGPGSYVLIEEL